MRALLATLLLVASSACYNVHLPTSLTDDEIDPGGGGGGFGEICEQFGGCGDFGPDSLAADPDSLG